MPLFFLSMKPTQSIYLAMLTLLVLLSYWAAGYAPFLNLDDMMILDSLQSSETSVIDLLFKGGGDYFRPLAILSFVFDLTLLGRSPAAFHWVNVTFHLTNTLLVYGLAQRLQPEDTSHRLRISFLAALFFGLHPINVEAVLWVAARTDLICCFFFLLSLMIAVDSRLSTSRAVVAIFLTSLSSLLAKEASVGLFIILGGYWLIQKSETTSIRLKCLTIATAFSTILYLFMRSGMQPRIDSGVTKVVTGGMDKSIVEILLDSCVAIGFYVGKLIYPYPLNFAIVNVNKTLSLAIFVVSLLVILTVTFKVRQLRFPVMMVIILLIPPVLALHGKLPWTPYAERYTYLPMTGFAIIVGVLVSRLPRFAYHFVFAAMMLLSVLTMQRVFVWTDSLLFWQDTLQKSPEFPRSYVALAYELLARENYSEAEVYLKKASQMGLNTDYLWQNLAVVRLRQGDAEDYEKFMARSAELSANSTEKYINLINTITRNSEEVDVWVRASGYYIKAYSKDPNYSDGLYNAAKIFMHLGDNKNAIKYFRLFLDNPGDSIYQPYALKLLKKIEQAGC